MEGTYDNDYLSKYAYSTSSVVSISKLVSTKWENKPSDKKQEHKMKDKLFVGDQERKQKLDIYMSGGMSVFS
jgi:hypothetical protein